MKNRFLIIILGIIGNSSTNTLYSQNPNKNVIARNLANYLTYYLNLDVTKREILVTTINNKELNYYQKITTLQNDQRVAYDFSELESLRLALINTANILNLQEFDLSYISIFATDTMIESIPNVHPCESYKREVNTCTRKMLDDWTDNWWNPLKLFFIAWEYNDCLKSADEKYPKCVVRHTIHRDLTQTNSRIEIGLTDPSIQK